MLTASQQGLFQPLKDAAWRAFCARNKGVDVKDKLAQDKWYRGVMVTHVGIWSTKEIKSSEDFERLCLIFATESGDAGNITYWAAAPERRALYRLRKTMQAAEISEAYVKGIARNMGFGNDLDDMPAEHINKLNAAVFIALKRKQAVAAKLEGVPF